MRHTRGGGRVQLSVRSWTLHLLLNASRYLHATRTVVRESRSALRGVLLLHQVKVNMWDLAGGQEYSEIRNEFYKASATGQHVQRNWPMP